MRLLLLSTCSSFIMEAPACIAKRHQKIVPDGGDDWYELPRRVVAEPPNNPLEIAVPASIVLAALLASMVVTVDVTDAPPKIGATPPRLDEWLGRGEAFRGVYRFADSSEEEQQQPFDLVAVASPFDLLAATLFQWRVFSLETIYPTGFGSDENAAIELLRALSDFFGKGLSNARKYESNCKAEVAAGPDVALTTLPPRVLHDDFVDGFGVSVAARADDALLGLATLRVKTLPADLWKGRGDARTYVAYITGLAVARDARRQGVASKLVDFSARKARAWGADAISLHVNKFNAPALRFYASLGFEVIPDWFGHNPARFLLYAHFDHLQPPPSERHPSAAAAAAGIGTGTGTAPSLSVADAMDR
ncbi:hypothetical protein CTAYLR_000623 [Chrysophaeum taylorii]|uniref:N-acetyltransferase domain-containing protein n=1 Tax=Chrysophaeum taylorii TaxID=2483200 RepID=A0AAD7U8I9_9STRA|nr:hypothetical protein CTAYLR_000623 [Chrysophaeum taylorii]